MNINGWQIIFYLKFKKIIIEWTGIGIQTTLSASDMTPKVKNIIEALGAIF